jgi:DHA1 family multidrug resistance protein-like MFS transporter
LLKARLYSGTVLVLGAVQLIESIATALPLSYFPNYVVGLGATVASVGLFTSSFMLASAVMSPRFGSFSDRHGRKQVMILGLIGDIIFGTLTGLAPSWLWLLLIRLINGAVSSAAMLAADALLIDIVPPNKRGEASGFIMSMMTIGRNVGPLFGGTVQWASVFYGLSVLDSYRVPYFVDSSLAVVALVLVVWKVRDRRPVETPTLNVSDVPSGNRHSVHVSSSYKVLLVYSFVTGIGVGFIMPIMVLFYNDKFGIDPIEIGLILTISGFVGLATSYVAGRLSDRAGRKPFIAAGNFTARVLDVALPLTGDVTQATGVVSFRSVGFNISMPALRALRADITPSGERGRYFGMFMTAWTAGDIIGPIFSTYLYDIYRFRTFDIGSIELPGYGIPFFVNSILGIAATVMLMIMVKEQPRQAVMEKGVYLE